MKKVCLFAIGSLALACLSTPNYAQKGLLKKVFDINGSVTEADFEDEKGNNLTDAPQVLRDLLVLKNEDKLQKYDSWKDSSGNEHEKYKQYYKGLEVEYAGYAVHAKKGKIKLVHGTFAKLNNLNVVPKVSESNALKKALDSVPAKIYKWQVQEEEDFKKEVDKDQKASYFPQGELIITGSNNAPKIGYKFDIYSHDPIGRYYVYVDAQTGEILSKESRICNYTYNGTANTRYSGTKTISTSFGGYTEGYKLKDERDPYHSIITKNMRLGTTYSSAIEFADADNNWTSAEYNNVNFDNAALDAHWGMTQVYEYFKGKFNHISFDGNGTKSVYSFVHIGDGSGNRYDNAFWDGSYFSFGDGKVTFKPLTSLDVVSHEFGHAFNQYTSKLGINAGRDESDALNEGLSDIWGSIVDYNTYTSPQKEPWTIGSENMLNGTSCLRSLRDPSGEPNVNSQDAKYYKGINWDNTLAAYYKNSGVVAHWFYLITNGKSGYNEKGQFYCVQPMGMLQTEQLIFQTQKNFSPNPNYIYSEFMNATLLAVKYMYGDGSYQHKQVHEAWYAVGVMPTQFISSLRGRTQLCTSATYAVTGYDPDGGTIYWSSNNSNVSVNSVGTVTRLNNYTGTAIITANVTDVLCPKVVSRTISFGCPGYRIGDESENVESSVSNEWSVMCMPNPATNSTTAIITVPDNGCSLTLLNIQGKQIFEKQGLISGNNEVVIPTEGLDAGLYFVKVTNADGKVFSVKLVIGN